MISIIAAIGKKRELGKNNKLLWHTPEDMKRFKAITIGHPVIMGRKTFESIGKPLSQRTNIVITRNSHYPSEGILIASSLQDALTKAKGCDGAEEIFIIGGGKIYAEAISIAHRLYLTIVEAEADADTFFPDYSMFTKKIEHKTEHSSTGYYLTYNILQRA